MSWAPTIDESFTKAQDDDRAMHYQETFDVISRQWVNSFSANRELGVLVSEAKI